MSANNRHSCFFFFCVLALEPSLFLLLLWGASTKRGSGKRKRLSTVIYESI